MGYMHALSWKLFIIGLLSEYFATLLKRLYLKKIAAKCSIFLQWLYFFLMGRSKVCFLGKDQISSWDVKRKGKEGGMGRSQNEGYFCKIPIIKQDTNFIYLTNFWLDKHLTTTIAIGMPKNLYTVIFKWFWSLLPGQKQLCVFLKNKFGFQIGNAMEKNKTILTRKKCSKWLDNSDS